MAQPGQDEILELAATLETCMERLNSIQKDLGLISTLVAMAAVNLRHHQGATPNEAELRELLASHHERLAETISVSLRSERPPGSQAEQIQLEPADHSLRAGRRRVALTESEYQVLDVLMQKRPEPVSRRQLLEHLYAEGEHPTHAVLDMFIYRIRQKLKSASVAATIRSVRGAGWVLAFEEAEDSESGALAPEARRVR